MYIYTWCGCYLKRPPSREEALDYDCTSTRFERAITLGICRTCLPNANYYSPGYEYFIMVRRPEMPNKIIGHPDRFQRPRRCVSEYRLGCGPVERRRIISRPFPNIIRGGFRDLMEGGKK